ncbi:hypothetical protein C9J85_13780 [Haloferax sp. wsp5]|nr:hypothetical protein C9J85_13780 [Haloferax sp. wsp5]
MIHIHNQQSQSQAQNQSQEQYITIEEIHEEIDRLMTSSEETVAPEATRGRAGMPQLQIDMVDEYTARRRRAVSPSANRRE